MVTDMLHSIQGCASTGGLRFRFRAGHPETPVCEVDGPNRRLSAAIPYSSVTSRA
jgi:hypothetical protein